MVDVDDGYTRIANELLDAILRYPFSKRELNIVLAVIRKTYGFNKKTDDISLSQLEKITGIRPSHLSTAINELVKQKVLLKQEGVFGQVLGLNKNYSKWLLLPKREVLPKQEGLPKRELTITETGTKVLPKQETQKTTPKDTTKDSKDPKNKFSDDDMRMAKLMLEKIRDVVPKTKEPNFENWANTIRLMRERDGLLHREIYRVFLWANRDDFWDTNILSPGKLREKFPRLSAECEKQGGPDGANRQTPGKNKTALERHLETLRAAGGGHVIDVEPMD